MTYKWISQEMKMLVIYLDCPAGWDHAEIKAESQGSILLLHRATDFLPRADAWAAAAELLLLLWPRGMELRAAFGFTTTLLWCPCTRGISEGSWKSVGAYLRYWNNSLFFHTTGTRKGWGSCGKAAWREEGSGEIMKNKAVSRVRLQMLSKYLNQVGFFFLSQWRIVHVHFRYVLI